MSTALLRVCAREKIFNRLEELKKAAKQLEFTQADLNLMDALISSSKTESELIEIGKFISTSITRAKNYFDQAV